MMTIPPVFVLSTGRCGSTMVSNILNRHPDILSLSEFFSFLGMSPFAGRRASGDRMWRLYSRPNGMAAIAAKQRVGELLYPLGSPDARFTECDLPPILATALPHITDRFEELFDELETVVRAQPRQSSADHFRYLFEWLGARFGNKVWVERGGASLLFASRLLRHFPEARVIHVYRDGRETALSMSNHPTCRALLALSRVYRPWGIDVEGTLTRLERHDTLTDLVGRVVWRVTNVERLPYDKVTLPDFAAFWSRMIETGHRVFGRFPADRLLNVRFEEVQADPEFQIRQLVRFIAPELEDDSWVREVASIPRGTPSKFARLRADEQQAITEACRPGLERLGYPI